MTTTSDLQQYTVADFVEWHEKKQLQLSPEFQRGSVWPSAARTYLIDTILRRLPIPKIYMRTRVDLETKRAFREVVDGQQRLRAILDYSADKFALGSRAGEFGGKRYSDLTPEEQERFLGFKISVDQLINATDADVLEVFSRLNSYTVPVNPPELRHAKYQGEFKWAVHDMAQRWSILWERYRVVGSRDAVRLQSDSLISEMYGIAIEGVRDGGQPKINQLYERRDKDYERGLVDEQVSETIAFIVAAFDEVLLTSAIAKSPHFLMLFAAVHHARVGIPQGDLEGPLSRTPLAQSDEIQQRLLEIAEVISADESPRGAEQFWRASKSSTQRIASRRVRFPVYLRAVGGQPLGW